MRTRPTIRALAVALVLLALAVCPALGDELPQWPNEQQAMLRNVEGQVLQVQSQLFAAHQEHHDSQQIPSTNVMRLSRQGLLTQTLGLGKFPGAVTLQSGVKSVSATHMVS